MISISRNDIIATIDDRIDRKDKKNFEEGTVIAVYSGVAKVKVFGTTQVRDAQTDKLTNDDVGKSCLIYKSKVTGKYLLVGIFSQNAVSSSAKTQALELFAPANFITLTSTIPDIIIAKWDSPIQRPVVIEVQSNTIEDEIGATSEAIQRGAYAFIESTTNLYLRARSIGEDFSYSAWTDWILGSPGVAPTVSLALDDLTDVVINTPSLGDIIIYDGTTFKNITPLFDGNGNLLSLDDKILWID